MVKKTQKKNNYLVLLEANKDTYKAEGETIFEALENIPLTWDKIKTKGVLTIKKDKAEANRLYTLVQIRRILANKLAKVGCAKNFNTLIESK